MRQISRYYNTQQKPYANNLKIKSNLHCYGKNTHRHRILSLIINLEKHSNKRQTWPDSLRLNVYLDKVHLKYGNQISKKYFFLKGLSINNHHLLNIMYSCIRVSGGCVAGMWVRVLCIVTQHNRKINIFQDKCYLNRETSTQTKEAA